MSKIFSKELLFLLLFFLTLFIIFHLSNTLIPFFIGIFIAYLLDPIVDWLDSKKLGRGFSTTITLFFFTIIIFFISFLILPILVIQIKDFLTDFPNVISDLNKKLQLLIEYLHQKFLLKSVSGDLNKILPNLANLITSFLGNLLTSSLAIFNIISILLVTPIVSWYFLKDWDKITLKISEILPDKYKEIVIFYTKNFNNIFDSYLRGQILVSTSLSILYFIAFSMLGLDYSLFVAIFAGFFSFIPFLGIIISFFVTSILCYLQFVELYFLLYVSIIFFCGQLLESNFLTPRFIGKKLGLHPLIVLLAIFVFGSLFGILGIIFSTPIVASLGLVLRRNLFIKNE